jgi:hypothetical protein
MSDSSDCPAAVKGHEAGPTDIEKQNSGSFEPLFS